MDGAPLADGGGAAMNKLQTLAAIGKGQALDLTAAK